MVVTADTLDAFSDTTLPIYSRMGLILQCDGLCRVVARHLKDYEVSS